ncbi:MAG TPA: hypothetical protein PKI12_07075, partial [Bacteroidales bacterium]|nr:hypothetical protein [Bacteroidales bacterium]
SEHEQIKRFRLVTEEWSPQSGELSPTLKLRRNYLMTRYKDVITDIYFGGEKEATMFSRIRNGLTETLKGLPKF